MRVVLAAGSTETARIDGLSAAGADAEAMAYTPGADAEVLVYGDVVRAPSVPVSPTGTPTPALVTRAAHEVVGFDVTVVDAGLAEPTGAPTVSVGARPGEDVREADPVPTAPGAFTAARALGRSLPDDHLVLAETIPGGTTTALGVLRALGEDGAVSSSLPTNPIERKREVVAEGLAASGLDVGDCEKDPRRAVRRMGDPVLATLAGVATGALAAGKRVTLAGGTQQLAVAALARHDGATGPLDVATTSYVAGTDRDVGGEAAGEVVSFRETARRFDCEPTVTDPQFDRGHVGFGGYVGGEAKEGVGMGGAVALANATGDLAAVRERAGELYDRLVDAGVDEATGGESTTEDA
ncbi:nicotinate-nucleotide--dimethylbenzimidazole phosphoribosyltransferase [Halorubellus sp. PRR65]|uniref:nicotinate-nucleotide--dimethylbenzimidazole phosphoribosyltransferase n=1 Tax=Halorubellus sp. PRR65 TaxID=3098148 RepID=UPI002B26422C|nr:nicotinate-nucleotide--dimethylbenzimidazole phosphoribosyltransferase [Halorubellus sp. PRR65]